MKISQIELQQTMALDFFPAGEDTEFELMTDKRGQFAESLAFAQTVDFSYIRP